ncbi:MAG: methyltransferase domain-containing protein [Acidobacteria bacterium]|nr:methyltransferase domain-containing protein [Acidobacteriota bacterium]
MKPSAEYDDIAEEYQASKWLPFRHYVERYTLLDLLGDVRGRTVLDMACGEGVYARQFKRQGATEVTGVDVSREMVALAQAQERAEPLGCRYVCADAADFTPDAPVDAVTAIYLLNYARTRAELERFCRACHRALRPGGRLVGFNDNVRRPPPPGSAQELAKYGFERTCAFPPSEGDAIRYRMTLHDDRVFEFDNYYLTPATYEAAMRAAGFADFRWVDARLEPSEREDPFWRDFFAHAPLTAFTARKAAPPTKPARR